MNSRPSYDSETSRRVVLEFVCIVGHDAIVKPMALGPVANTDTKLLIYGLWNLTRFRGHLILWVVPSIYSSAPTRT